MPATDQFSQGYAAALKDIGDNFAKAADAETFKIRIIPMLTAQIAKPLQSRADLLSHASFSALSTDSDGNPCVWLNHYACDCGNEWSDAWSCQCDDECSECGSCISPTECDWLGPIDATELAIWENLPEAGERT